MKQHNTLGNILLADDYIPLLRNMGFLLEVAGFDVTAVTDGQEALKALELQVPDMIISDILMPNLDGFGLLQAVRNDIRWHKTPFIFATAQYEYDDLMYGLDMGANDYVPKPFDIYDILDAIHRSVPNLITGQEKLAG
jgi:CheY-like chemotaxis protein